MELQAEFSVAQGTRFGFQHHGQPVPNRVGKTRAFGNQFLLFTVVFERSFSDRADQQFKQFSVHVLMVIENAAKQQAGK